MADDTTPSNGSMNPALAAILGIGGAIAGRKLSQNAASSAVPPELSQLLQMGAQRAAYQNPMFQATTQGLYGMLPDFAKQGTSLSGTLSNQVPQATSGGSNPLTSLNPATNPLLAGLLGSGLTDAAKGNIPFKSIIEGLKKLFGGTPGKVKGTTLPDDYWANLARAMGVEHNTGVDWGSMFGPGSNDGPPLISDPGIYTGWNGLPTDPSGGTGVGPGMAGYGGGGDPSEE